MANDFEHLLWALSENLVQLRTQRDVSQEALALEAGVDRTFVSKIERRKANPSLATLCALAGALEVKTVSLLVPPVPHSKREK